MTNKINGIDVSECCCFENNRCLWSKRYYENNNVAPSCEAVKNCYFKQLKRLQEENKRLQMLSCANCGEKYLSPDGSELYEKNVQLQKENEKLKKVLQELKELSLKTYDVADFQMYFDKLRGVK